MHVTLLTLVAVPLFVPPPAPPAAAEMPDDFLKVESRAWGRWLDEKIDVSWGNVPLKNVLATEFGPAEFAVDPAKAMDKPITFDIRDTSRRAALWRMSRQYDFAIRWTQKEEPKVFMGLSEAEHRKHQVGGVTLTAITQVMQSDYKPYLDWKRKEQVTKEQVIDGRLYYAIDVDRDLDFGCATAHVIEVQRYRTTLPPKETGATKKQ